MAHKILSKVQEIRHALEGSAQPLAEGTPQVSTSSMLQMFVVELYSALREVYGWSNVSSMSGGTPDFSLLIRAALPEAERKDTDLPEAMISISDTGMKIKVWVGKGSTQVEETVSSSLRGLCLLSPKSVVTMLDGAVRTALQKYKSK